MTNAEHEAARLEALLARARQDVFDQATVVILTSPNGRWLDEELRLLKAMEDNVLSLETNVAMAQYDIRNPALH